MRKRKFWSVALATAVATMLPVSALAKTWDNVDSWDKLAGGGVWRYRRGRHHHPHR